MVDAKFTRPVNAMPMSTPNTPFFSPTGKTLADLEQTSLSPKVVGRIIELNSDVSNDALLIKLYILNQRVLLSCYSPYIHLFFFF